MKIDPSVKNFINDPKNHYLMMEDDTLKAVAGKVASRHLITFFDCQKLEDLQERFPLARKIITIIREEQTGEKSNFLSRIWRTASSKLFRNNTIKELDTELIIWCELAMGDPQYIKREIAWQRIRVAYVEKASRLDFSSLELTLFPKALKLLPHLQELDCSGNDPIAIFYAEGLDKLKIMYNGLGGEAALIQIAKHAAAQNGELVSDGIQKSGIQDQTALIEIAKIAAAQNGEMTTYHIQNYGITNQTALIQIAKIAAAQDGKGTSEYIQQSGITDQTALIEIAKIAAAQNGNGTLEHIPNYGIKDPAISTALKILCTAHIACQPPVDGAGLSAAALLARQMSEISDLLKPIPKTSALSRYLEASQEKTVYHIPSKEQALACCCLQEIKNSDARHFEDILAIVKYRNSAVAFQIATHWIEIAKNPKAFDTYQKSIKDAQYLALPMILVSSLAKGSPELSSFLKAVPEALKPHRAAFKDAKTQLLSSLINTLMTLEKTAFQQEEKIRIIQQLFRKELSSSQLLKACRILQVICTLKISLEKLPVMDCSLANLENHFISGIKNLFEITTSIENFSEKYLTTFGNLRVPYALELYAGKVTDPSVKTKLSQLVLHLLQGSFKQERYRVDNNPHLKEIQEKHPALFEKWQQSSSLAPITVDVQTERQRVAIAPLLKQKFVTDDHFQFLPEGKVKCALLIEFLGKKGKEQAAQKATFLEKIAALEDNSTKEMQRLCIELCDPSLSEEAQKELLQRLNENMDPFKDSQVAQDIRDLSTLVSRPQSSKGSLTASITDDWQDLFLCGTEVIGSCQSINTGFATNKCLLAYVMDGKNLLADVKDESGKIVSRSILRVLLDKENKPALFQERLYPSPCPVNQLKALHQLCLNLSENLGIPLMTINTDYPLEPGLHSLRSLGSNCPFEYSDAGDGVTNGQFTIANAQTVIANR